MLMGEVIERNLGFLGFPDYSVDTEGNVWSYKKGEKRVLKPAKDKCGYLYVQLWVDGKRKKYMVHRLVALSFPEICGELFDGCECNHINEDKEDNRAVNLNWMTPKENINWGTRNQRAGDALKGKYCGENSPNWGKHHTDEARIKISDAQHKKAVQQFVKTGELIATYQSTCEAERATGIDQSSICNCCNHKPHNKTAGGFIWRYA